MQIDPDTLSYLLEGVKYVATTGLVYIGSRAVGKKAAASTVDSKLEGFDAERNARIAILEESIAKSSDEKNTLLQKIAHLELSLAKNQTELAECKQQLAECKFSLDQTTEKVNLTTSQLQQAGRDLAASVKEIRLLRKELKKEREKKQP